uniref:Anaphase-promoting complex subunit 4 WD40 domain-containing protein n=1 Tax=Eucampia antarctica TaxID=49252 RepID=A0A7S2R138_9STRA|mmetsp:Transcript_1079/g.987  ORF Transcript_1079/g.987 Transcript_1079/m.987 type:complete len:624 (+) Transcript_1079:145-2016(+)|eukprot:CAMPEP_0197836546 /NCGR_PEP_ID=MMETSP1437-20131217/29352_1 /TAXON_ID=49252 ORGANISM="Eucampia antarctica, Strain CCMP1452" /NCGR_SAMPLE_ID=MMETSP1437 /ASSEMBLY_ACC=CAM_ASM_001096 /LENGTH=623 /DNA_ID=CAMNT_0043442815 /DNA_START=126 /DNA_END=1997 /DNA_ORIENTATION=+
MISCIEWMPRGAADPNPKRYELSGTEREMMEKQAEMEKALESGVEIPEVMSGDEEDDDDGDNSNDANVDGVGEASKIIAANQIDPSTLPAEYNMDDYSDDEDEGRKNATIGNLLVGQDTEMIGIHLDENGKPVLDDEGTLDGKNPAEYDSDDSDDNLDDVQDTREYMPVDVEGLEAMQFSGTADMNYGDNMDDDDDDDNSDVEDTNLKPDDSLVIVGKTEDDFASLEVFVYEETTGNLFVHHDIPLPSFPLCLAHGDINSDGNAGNYVAVGTFNPGIEVWNLDILDALEPMCILGGEDTSAADNLMRENIIRASTGKKMNKKKCKSGGGLRLGSHTDAVMSLSWNKVHRQLIASGSADNTVKVWDITQAAETGAAATYRHHQDKVQSVAWHPSEGTILATGSYDRTVCLVDARSGDGNNCKKVKIPADIEALAWDPHQQHYISAACEDGSVVCWDVRNFDQPCWSFVAHEFGGCSDLSYNNNIPGMLATCAVDKTVALWDTQKASSGSNNTPVCCGKKEMEVGKLYTCSFYTSSPWLLGCGGGGANIALWDLGNEDKFRKRFESRITNAPPKILDEDDSKKNQEDFEAVMAATDATDVKVEEKEVKTTKKKVKGKGKKKAHRK